MRATKSVTVGMVIAALVMPSPLYAAEVWSCVFAGFRGTVNKLPSQQVVERFRVDGDLLFQGDGKESTDPFRILENSKTAIVAAKGGTYNMFESEPRISSSVVMIKKDTGQFVFSLASVGTANERTTGVCRLITNGTTSK